MSKSKESSGWVSSTFGDIVTQSSSSQSKPLRGSTLRIRASKRTLVPDGQTTWIDKHSPLDKEDLAVHKKKVELVEDSIKQALVTLQGRNKRCPLLLLTGPSGTGKTATIIALATHLNLSLSEWKNANQYVLTTNYQSNESMIFEERQITSFESFLLRASRYSALFQEQQQAGRLILVEDVPNACLREPESFHHLLRRYAEVGQSPTVFIISDSNRGELSSNKLFPKDLIIELGIQEISFNPITTLSISKVYQKILSLEKAVNNQIRSLSKTELDVLAEASAGDIRSAINALQFSASPGAIRKAVKKVRLTGGKITESKGCDSPSGGKDTALVLFHSLGKILYCKRDVNKTEPSLPKHLKKHERLPLVENPETIVERTVMSSGGFNLFLHQNYSEFFDDSEKIAEASHNLSTADCLLPRWEDQSNGCLNEYGSSVAVRGLMFHLGLPKKHESNNRNKFMPLRKPAWYETNRTVQKNLFAVQSEFKDYYLNLGRELNVTVIPYMVKIPATFLTNSQKNIIQSLTRFSRGYIQRFRESEVLEEEDEDVFMVTNNSVVMDKDYNTSLRKQDDYEVHIKEFSD